MLKLSVSMPSTLEKTPWLAQGDEKRKVVRDMFADIAPRYDLLNSLMSFGLHHRWRKFAAAQLRLKAGDTVLDLCSGTGDFVPILRNDVGQNGQVIAADFCRPMLDLSRGKNPETPLAVADACNLPFGDARFDGVSVGWGIRNVPDMDLAHREIARILKPGGRFVSVDMARPRNKFLLVTSGFMTKRVLPLLGGLFGKSTAYTYLPESAERFADRDTIKRSMEAAGFHDVNYRDMFFGTICAHWGQK